MSELRPPLSVAFLMYSRVGGVRRRGGLRVKSAKSQFPVAKVPFPRGSEVSCGFRRGSGVSETVAKGLTPLNIPTCRQVRLSGITAECGGGGGRGGALNACQGLIIVSLRRAGVPAAEPR